MKKLIFLAAVAALAFGAQANYTYTYDFKLQLDNIPAYNESTGRPDHNFIYLTDKDETTVYCYVYRGVLKEREEKYESNIDMEKDGDNWKLKDTRIVHSASDSEDSGQIFNALTGKKVIEHELSSASIEKTGSSGSNERTFLVHFNSNEKLEGLVDWVEGENIGNTGNLKIVVTEADYIGSDYPEYKVDDKLGAERTTVGGSSISLGGYVAYSVPEPTSAMLLLLGFAGLVLKRKVA